MRKSVFFILLATAAMPVLAAAPDPDGQGGNRGSRAESSENRGSENSQRTQRAARSERADSGREGQRAARSERARAPRREQPQQIVQSSGQQSQAYSEHRNRARSRSDDGASSSVVTRDSTQGVTNLRARERRAARSADIPATAQSTTSGYSGDRSGTNWRDRTRNSQTTTTTNRLSNWNDRHGGHDGHRWSSDWRHDNRYNWRHHRSRYSSLYRLGRYYDPYRYGYRRFSIGLTLGSGYYNNSNYWLNDPWQYRLPPAYGPYRWIRYYNDALLVNIYSGEVADVIYGFFW